MSESNTGRTTYEWPVGDGIVDDTDSLQWYIDESADTGRPLYLDPGKTYLVTSQILLRGGVQIIGRTYRNDTPKRPTIKSGASLGNSVLLIQSGATNVILDNIKIDADDSRTSCVKGTTCTNVVINNCEITNLDSGYLIDFNGDATDLRITNNQLSETIGGIRLQGDIRRATVSGNYLTEWLDYGIVVYADDDDNPAYVSIENNTFETPSTGAGGARQMIVSYYAGDTEAASIIGLRVLNNMCIGPGTPFSLVSTSSRGTGDQISINYCTDFEVRGNVSTGGGENGLVVQFSEQGVVADNEVSGADAHGIQVSSLNFPCVAVNITGNSCTDNAVRADGSGDVMAGIYVQDGEKISIIGNQIVDTRATRSTKYGILVAVTEELYLGPNAVQFEDTDGMVPFENQSSTRVPGIESTVWNVQEFGALGNGSTDDGAAIDAAIIAANAAGGGIVYFPPTDSFYKITQPIYMLDNVILRGEGYASWIKNTRSTQVTAGDLRVVDFGNHTSTTLLAETSYAVNDCSAGAASITTTTAADAANFPAGTLLFLASSTLVGSIPVSYEVNEVVSSDAGTGVLTLKYPVYAAFSGGQVIRNPNGVATDPLGQLRRFTKRTGAENLRLTTTGNDWWHASGGCFESRFRDLWIESRTCAIINGFARSLMSHIKATFDDRAIEFGIGSHHSTLEKLDLGFYSRGSTTTSEPLVAFGEASHHMVVRDFRINAGVHAGGYGVRFLTCSDCTVRNGDILTTALTGGGQVSFSASVGTCVRNKCYDVDFTGPNAHFVQFDYGAAVTSGDNAAERCRFFGTPTTRAATFTDGDKNRIASCYFENGGYSIAVACTNPELVDSHFAGSASRTNSSVTSLVRNLATSTTKALRGLIKQVINQTINSTSANNVVTTISCAAAVLEANDEILFEIDGTIAGTNDAKTVQVVMNSNTITAIAYAAANTGAFMLRGRILTVFATTTKRSMTFESSTIGDDLERASFSLNTNTTAPSIEVQAWVANASDTITIDRIRFDVHRPNE